MQSIPETEAEIIEEFSLFDDWMDKYEYIIELGKNLPLIDEAYKNEEHLIKGCQSRVWIHAEAQDDCVVFTADSDAIITKGIVALLIRVLSGQKASDVADADLRFIDTIGLKEHLTPTRSNGLVSMVKQMKAFAAGLQKVNG
ncbi:MAG: SufE family protein [Bacteroidia bacterium]|nr:SufE family protein [Bacteroidia bacterium]